MKSDAFRTIELELEAVCASEIVSGRRLYSSVTCPINADAMVAKLWRYVATERIERHEEVVRFEHPATWWQHFKQAYFPAWLLRRWPVVLREVFRTVSFDVRASYPHIQAPERLGRRGVLYLKVEQRPGMGERIAAMLAREAQEMVFSDGTGFAGGVEPGEAEGAK